MVGPENSQTIVLSVASHLANVNHLFLDGRISAAEVIEQVLVAYSKLLFVQNSLLEENSDGKQN